MAFIKVGETREIKMGEMKPFNIGGKEILIAGYEGDYYAIDNKCPHLGGDLSKGRLEGKTVSCPRHKSKFDITTGKCISGPKIGFLKLNTRDAVSYKVRIKGKNIEVGV